MDAEQFFAIPQYSLSAAAKREMLSAALFERHETICNKLFPGNPVTLEQIPFLPVNLFKNHTLRSIPEADVFKVLTSSGTTGNVPSRIYLDKATAQLQTRALSNIMQVVLGKERLPMLISDTSALIKDRNSFSARGAGVLGMSVFGKSHAYLLDEHMAVNATVLKEFLAKHGGSPFLIFGFTFMVWQFLYESVPEADLSNGILIHSGGWKKLLDQAVDNATFKRKLNEKFGLKQSFNFYGMVEQVGSVFLECTHGFLHTPNFADVLVRSPFDFAVVQNGQPGVIQVLSILPGSYPGISLLTEDLGTIHGEDTCACGRKGKYFSVSGRMKKAELRGCSDTFTLSN
jgi:phenylacetate-coenzyme A ligase PaaK-like adenylate-forming protein